MAQRAARGESLFHPHDASLDGDWGLIVVQSQTGRPIVIGQLNQRTRAIRLWAPTTAVTPAVKSPARRQKRNN